jgi:exosome complex RNA-binding protein Csl4
MGGMDPSSNQAAGMPASAPVNGQPPVIPLPEPGSQIAAETVPLNQAPQIVPITTVPLPTTAAPTNPQASAAVSQSSGLPVADDKDVIEPEWVHKARAIVTTTIDDPYKQSEDLTVLKADYMQKRYNKIVKLK